MLRTVSAKPIQNMVDREVQPFGVLKKQNIRNLNRIVSKMRYMV